MISPGKKKIRVLGTEFPLDFPEAIFVPIALIATHAPQLQNERLEEASHTAKENQIKVAQYSFQHFARRRLWFKVALNPTYRIF